MKKLIYLLPVSVIYAFSAGCGQDSTSGNFDSDYHSNLKYFDSAKPKNTGPVITYEEFVPAPVKEKIWAEKKVLHAFSDPAKKDQFHVRIAGDKYYSANVILDIYRDDGTKIYSDSFPFTDMLSIAFEGDGHYATEIQKEEFMKKHIHGFFNEKYFSSPAVKNPDDYAQEFRVPGVFEAISGDTAAISFYYNKRRDSQTSIAFDRQGNQGVKFFEY
jgi:hypothetical protein